MKLNRMAVLAALTMVAGAQAQTITQSFSLVIEAGSSVACQAGGITADNQYYRGFDLVPDHGIAGPWVVSSVSFGVEAATAGGTSGVQPVTVELYDGFVRGATTLTPGALIGTAGTSVADGSLFMHSVAVAGVVTSGKLVVKLLVADSTGAGAGHSFFLGANDDGQLKPSYLSSTSCGLPGPVGTDTAAIGFPGAQWVMEVTGAPVPEPASMIALSLGAAALLRKRRNSK